VALVIDATGSRPMQRGGGGAQTAYGLTVDLDTAQRVGVLPGVFTLMDWSRPPTFLYGAPFADGSVLVEETSLYADPPRSLEYLAERLGARLEPHGRCPTAPRAWWHSVHPPDTCTRLPATRSPHPCELHRGWQKPSASAWRNGSEATSSQRPRGMRCGPPLNVALGPGTQWGSTFFSRSRMLRSPNFSTPSSRSRCTNGRRILGLMHRHARCAERCSVCSAVWVQQPDSG